jgi:O-antigen/teichoic acid export membrane protein
VSAATKILTILLFLSYYKMDIKGVIYATIISSLVTSVYQYMAIPSDKKFEFDGDVLKKMFRFGFPLGLNNVMSFVFMKVDRFMLGAMLSPIHVAYYEIASKLPECGRTLYDAYLTVFFPSMSELCASEDHDAAGKILNYSIRILSFASLLATFVLYLFQYEVVGALFSKRYLLSAPAVPLLMIVLCLDLTGNMLGTTLVAYGQSDKPVKINIFAAATTVISNLILIPRLGFIGAAYTCILSRVITNPINVWYLNKQGLHVDVFQYLKPLGAFFICFLITLMLKPESVCLKLIHIVFFIIINIMMSVIGPEDIVLAKKHIIRQVG